MWNCNNPYAYRDENLRILGFSSYQAYLRSPLWRAVKVAAFKRFGRKCQRCGSVKRVQIHHRAYDMKTLTGAVLDALSIACRACHCRAERPTDFGRTRYERLQESSEFLVLTKPEHPELPRCPLCRRKLTSLPKGRQPFQVGGVDFCPFHSGKDIRLWLEAA